jgi:hypothetical protein
VFSIRLSAVTLLFAVLAVVAEVEGEAAITTTT